MERLTIKHNFELRGLDGKQYKASEVVLKSTGMPAENDEIREAYNKLAEFEDFMEEQGVQSLEDFKKALEIKLPDERVKQIALEEMRKEMKNHIAQILKKEVPELYKYKDKWQKLKEYAEYTFNLDKCNLALAQVLDKMQELERR